ncbi:Uu.00g072630.m01.CDS01 [Anthostomella pinea]|uniref:Uu.00g072630.m01.CDS01 n=1 Tax=Anthostomella pinea TaxID=933095 RepID=A0AAI8VWC0_9PEZI|nr:Uu.00g072630.m01.CDS01 [Anthostomella pinea]
MSGHTGGAAAAAAPWTPNAVGASTVGTGGWSSASSSKRAKTSVFTGEMRDRQARGKDPYDDSEDGSDWTPGEGREGGRGRCRIGG